MVRTGRSVDVTDVDELLVAVRDGLLSPEAGERAVHTALSTVDALATHDHDLHRWLATLGVTLTWRDA